MKKFDFSQEPFETLMTLQKNIFEMQLNDLHRLMGDQVDLCGFDPVSGKSPSAPYRKKRHHIRAGRIRARLSEEEEGALQVTPDEVEVKLAGLLDPMGGLASLRAVETYLNLMVAARTVEKKALLLAALHATPSQASLAHFVQCGGLKVLKHWVKDASEAGKGELVALCLEAVKDLPVTEEAVRQSEIARAIKRLKRAKGGRQASAQVLSMADQIMGQWTAALQSHRGPRKRVASPPADRVRAHHDKVLNSSSLHLARRRFSTEVPSSSDAVLNSNNGSGNHPGSLSLPSGSTSGSVSGGSEGVSSLGGGIGVASPTTPLNGEPQHRSAKKLVSILSTSKDKQTREGQKLSVQDRTSNNAKSISSNAASVRSVDILGLLSNRSGQSGQADTGARSGGNISGTEIEKRRSSFLGTKDRLKRQEKEKQMREGLKSQSPENTTNSNISPPNKSAKSRKVDIMELLKRESSAGGSSGGSGGAMPSGRRSSILGGSNSAEKGQGLSVGGNAQPSLQESVRTARQERHQRRKQGEEGGGSRYVADPIPLINERLRRNDSMDGVVPPLSNPTPNDEDSDPMDVADEEESGGLAPSDRFSTVPTSTPDADPFNVFDMDLKPREMLDTSPNIEANLPVIQSFSTKGPQKKKSTKRIRWADREGKELRQVHLFVTEEFEERGGQEQHVSLIGMGMPEDLNLNREDTQLLLEDLARRERELEREMLKKEREVAAKLRADELEQQRIALQRMAPNRKWMRPRRLALAEELEPAVNLESKELKQQHLRTKRLMEMHYISASDVPPSPAEPSETGQAQAVPSSIAKTIPLEDVAEVPTKTAPKVENEKGFIPESSPAGIAPGRGLPAMQIPPGPPPGPPPPPPPPRGPPLGLNPMNNMQMHFQMLQQGEMGVDQLPTAFKDLDPAVLRILVDNEHLVRNLMGDDGNLDERALVQLVTSLTPPTADSQNQSLSGSNGPPLQMQNSQPIMPGAMGMNSLPPPPPPLPMNPMPPQGVSMGMNQGGQMMHPCAPQGQPDFHAGPPPQMMLQPGPPSLQMARPNLHNMPSQFHPSQHPTMMVMVPGFGMQPGGGMFPMAVNGPLLHHSVTHGREGGGHRSGGSHHRKGFRKSDNQICSFFNSPKGCQKNGCPFIHDPNYQQDPRSDHSRYGNSQR